MLVATALLWSGWTDVRTYVVDYAADPRVAEAFGEREMAIARELIAAPDQGAYSLAPHIYLSSVIRFLTAGSASYDDVP